MGKLLERLIYNRLVSSMKRTGILPERQYGFRRARSTFVDVAPKVISVGKCCAVVMLDFRNAFYPARSAELRALWLNWMSLAT